MSTDLVILNAVPDTRADFESVLAGVGLKRPGLRFGSSMRVDNSDFDLVLVVPSARLFSSPLSSHHSPVC